MTMKIRTLAMLILALSVLIGGGFCRWCFSGKPTAFSFSRIRSGMTLEEVEAILGPGNEVRGDQVPQFGQSRIVEGVLTDKVVEGDKVFNWRLNDEVFWISFSDNKVVEKYHSVSPLF